MNAAILLPGITVPAHVAFASLLAELGPSVEVVTKELEVYVGAQPPEGYSLSTELDGLDRFAAEQGYDASTFTDIPWAEPSPWPTPLCTVAGWSAWPSTSPPPTSATPTARWRMAATRLMCCPRAPQSSPGARPSRTVCRRSTVAGLPPPTDDRL